LPSLHATNPPTAPFFFRDRHPAGLALSPAPAKTRTGEQAMDKDRIEGTVKQAKGAVKEAYGKVTGDTATQVDGAAEKAAGKGQQAAGKAKDAARDAVDAVKG
jgi:uncharacterized protein YjbJ (UPF0337 family)